MTATTKRLQQGLSLVEILVALLISVFLLGGIIQVYVGNKTSYRFSDAAARVQENGRFALETITNDTRLAGFYGCVDIRKRLDLVQNHLNTASANYDPAVHGFATRSHIAVNAGTGLNGSDGFTIRGSSPGQAVFSTTLAKDATGSIQVTGDTVFRNNDIVLITNCLTSDIFEATAVSRVGNVTTIEHTLGSGTTTPGNMNLAETTCGGTLHCLFGGMTLKENKTMDELNNNFEDGYKANSASAYRLQTVTYSVAPSASDDSIPALWRMINGNNEELIDGIERMNVLFGLDDDIDDVDDSPKQYVTANAITNAQLEQVTAVRVFLVARSEDDFVLDQSQNYAYMGATQNEGDRRLRQVFTSTVDLRNR